MTGSPTLNPRLSSEVAESKYVEFTRQTIPET